MERARKKELLGQFRQSRTEMGVYAVRCAAANRVYLGTSTNLPGAINSVHFQLSNGSFPTNRRLAEDWARYGEDGCLLETLETMAYDKDDDGTKDYREDLKVLKKLWREKLEAEGIAVDNIRPVDR